MSNSWEPHGLQPTRLLHPRDFPGKSTIILDIDYREKKKTIKNTNTCRLNNAFLNNEQISIEIREIKTFLETRNNENVMI